MTDIFIHDSANISPKSEIGKGTKIWINVQVRESAIVGENCIISKDVYIDHAVVIGNRCKIQNSVSIYNGVTIGDDVFVGPNVTFTNDKVPRAFNTNWRVTTTLIENGASLGANSTIVCGMFLRMEWYWVIRPNLLVMYVSVEVSFLKMVFAKFVIKGLILVV